MIISHKHKYIFVELPRTGSTAISKELRENYDGERIRTLRKHAYFHEFQTIASHEEKKYFVFSCLRNPLDDVVSMYFKFKTNHLNEFTEAKDISRMSLKKFKFIRNNNDFSAFLKKFYKIPYDNWSSFAHKKFNYVIRYENIQTDFKKVLEQIGLEQKRPLPVINKTNEKGHFLSYYTPKTHAHLKYIFGPFMKRWDFEFPPDCVDSRVPLSAEILFIIFSLPRKIYWRYIQNSTSTFVKLFKRIIGR